METKGKIVSKYFCHVSFVRPCKESSLVGSANFILYQSDKIVTE